MAFPPLEPQPEDIPRRSDIENPDQDPFQFPQSPRMMIRVIRVMRVGFQFQRTFLPHRSDRQTTRKPGPRMPTKWR